MVSMVVTGKAKRAMNRLPVIKRIPRRVQVSIGLSRQSYNAAASGICRSSYDAASAALRTVDYTNAADIGPNTALLNELHTIRRRARFELRNNGIARGLGRTYANVAVCSGPLLKLKCSDMKWAKAVEEAFSLYAEHCEFRRGKSLTQMIHLGVKQFFPCGEYIIVPRIDPSVSPEEVQLRFLMIRPDRLDSSYNAAFTDGIETDIDGRPKTYWISREDPDNIGRLGAFFDLTNYDPVPASKIIHVFLEDDPIQLRGEPWLAQALNIFHKIRRLDDSTLNSAQIAERFGVFLTQLVPELAMDYGPSAPDEEEFSDGVMRTLPPGVDAKQIDSNRPTPELQSFRRSQLAAAGRAACMPVNAVTGDSSEHNFASARFDGLLLLGDVDVVRGEIENQHLNRVFEWWLMEAFRVGVVDFPSAPYQKIWLWPETEAHTDPLKAANARGEDLKNGTRLVEEVVAADGRDPDNFFARKVAEVQKYHDAGLRHPSEQPTPAGNLAGQGD